MFQCKLCGRTYISKFSLHLHINNFHKGIKRYSCEYCEKTYAQKHNLKIHLKSVHKKDINEGSKNFLDDSPKISQDVNNQKFSSEKEGTKNINVTTTANSPPDLKLASFGTAFTKTTDNAEKMNKCHICDKEFDQDQLEIHFLTSHSMEDEEDTKENIHEESKQLIEMKKVDEGNTPAKIKEPNVDDSIFPNNLTTQNVPYKSQENISQDVHEGSTNSSNVSITKSIHEGLKFQSQEFISPNVHEGSKNLSNVNVTKSNHNGLNFQSQKIISPNVHEGSKDSIVSQSAHDGLKLLFKCKFCDGSYSSAQSLSYHFNSFHKESKKWPCKYCGKTYTRNQNLKSHLASIHGKFSCECATCGITCDTSISLKYHIKIAHEEKIIKVEEDSKDVHEGGAKNEYHKCQKCGLIYNHANNLLQHIKYVHEGEKYVCPICKRLFTQPYSLIRHKRSIHDGIKSFSCESCNERFTQSSSLKRHIIKAHGDITLAKIKEPNVDDSIFQDNPTTQNVPDQSQEKVQEISNSQNVNVGKDTAEVKIDNPNVLENENDSVTLKSETKLNFDQSNSKNIIVRNVSLVMEFFKSFHSSALLHVLKFQCATETFYIILVCHL